MDEKQKEVVLNRLKQEYVSFRKSTQIFHGVEQVKNKVRYNAMRLFCLDCSLLSFNEIEIMEFEVDSSF